MRAILLTILAVFMIVNPVSAQWGFFNLHDGLISPAQLCWIYDRVEGMFKVYLYHEFLSDGALGSRLMIRSSEGFSATYIGETHEVFWIGNTQTGIQFVYLGGCTRGSFLLSTISYYGYGTSEDCSYLEVIADPAAASGWIEITDCSGQIREGRSQGIMMVNPVEKLCDPWCILPVGTTTWGRIKQLYSK